MRALIFGLFLCLAFTTTASQTAPVQDKTFPWREWSQAVFEEARRDNKYVVLSLQS
jgi:hypothetical protein